MAKQARYRWRGFGQQAAVKPRRRRKGISNKQAQYLAHLQRAAGESYSGAGLSREEASLQIARLKREVAEHRRLDDEWGQRCER